MIHRLPQSSGGSEGRKDGQLTAKHVENVNEPSTYEDGNGLRLIVKATGRNNWVLRFKLHGKQREMGLGGYPHLDLKKARAAAYENKAQILKGIDPLAKRQAEQAAQREAERRELTQGAAEEERLLRAVPTKEYVDGEGFLYL
ncbi:Arm DNA-binding domain-containing protein, partial [Pseudomonas syringae]